MARLELVPGKVSRLVDFWRDSRPLPGERPATEIVVQTYKSRPETVSTLVVVQSPKWTRFWVDPGPKGDRLLAALKDGPVKAKQTAAGGYSVDLDRIERP